MCIWFGGQMISWWCFSWTPPSRLNRLQEDACICITIFCKKKTKTNLISKLEISNCNRHCRTTFPAPTAALACGGEVVLWFRCLDEIFTISCKKIISAERAWGSPSSLGMSQSRLGWKTKGAEKAPQLVVCVNWGTSHLQPRAVMCGTINWLDILNSAPVPSAAVFC